MGSRSKERIPRQKWRKMAWNTASIPRPARDTSTVKRIYSTAAWPDWPERICPLIISPYLLIAPNIWRLVYAFRWILSRGNWGTAWRKQYVGHGIPHTRLRHTNSGVAGEGHRVSRSFFPCAVSRIPCSQKFSQYIWNFSHALPSNRYGGVLYFLLSIALLLYCFTAR